MKHLCFPANGFFSRPTMLLTLAILLLGVAHSPAQKSSDENRRHFFAYVGNEFSDSVSVINTRTNSVIANILVPENTVGPVGVAVTPDGKRAYVSI